MGWLFSHPTRDALIAELTANDETDNCTRTVLDRHLVDNVLWQVVRLVGKSTLLEQIKCKNMGDCFRNITTSTGGSVTALTRRPLQVYTGSIPLCL